MANEPIIEQDNEESIKKVESALKDVMDPELHVDIWTLELIKKVELKAGQLKVIMTLTTPFCPYGPALIQEAKDKLLDIDGIENAEIELDFNEPWHPSEDLKAYLGISM